MFYTQVFKILDKRVVTADRHTTYWGPDEYPTASTAYTVLRDRLIQEQVSLQARIISVNGQLLQVEANLHAALAAERREEGERSSQLRELYL